MTAVKKIIFGPQEIKRFCEITEGPYYNKLHDPSYMERQKPNGKLSVVPGFLTMSYALNQLAIKDFLSEPWSINANFNEIVSSGDKISLVYEDENNDSINISANIWNAETAHNFLLNRNEIDHLLDGRKSNLILLGKNVDEFSELTNAQSLNSINSFLYAMASSPQVLINNIKDPLSSEESELKEKYEKDILPVFTSMEIFAPNGIPELGLDLSLDFLTKIEKTDVTHSQTFRSGLLVDYWGNSVQPLPRT